VTQKARMHTFKQTRMTPADHAKKLRERLGLPDGVGNSDAIRKRKPQRKGTVRNAHLTQYTYRKRGKEIARIETE
jgi:hypothetical protein